MKFHGSSRKTSYFTGKLESANHEVTGEIEAGDTVRLFGTQNQTGVVKSITRSNFGKGRPVAIIVWDGGRETKEPLGRLRKTKDVS